MFKWLQAMGSKERPDHPMFSLREAEKLLGDLPEGNSGQALEEIASWAESVGNTPGFAAELHAEILQMLEDRGTSYEEKLVSDYIRAVRLHDHRSRDQVQKAIKYRTALCDAYLSALVDDFGVEQEKRSGTDEDLLALLCRGLRCAATVVKLRHLGYQSVEPAIWGHLYRLYRLAETVGLQNRMMKVYKSEPEATSVTQELLRGLMLEIGAPESLASEHVELAARMVARIAGAFAIGKEATAELPYSVDLAQAGPPTQYGAKPSVADTARFFGASGGLGRIEEFRPVDKSAPIPGEKHLGQEFSSWDQETVVKHLVLYWGKNRPFRQFKRDRTAGKVYVLNSLPAIRQVVMEISTDQTETIERSIEADGETLTLEKEEVTVTPEIWDEIDVSEGGVGVRVPRGAGDWVKIGRLCAVKRSDSDYWWVGVLRRLDTKDPMGAASGIEILSKNPASLWLKRIGKEGQLATNWATSSGSHRFEYVNAVLLAAENETGAKNAKLALRPKDYMEGLVCEALMGDKTRLIRLGAARDTGEDYVVAAFAWM